MLLFLSTHKTKVTLSPMPVLNQYSSSLHDTHWLCRVRVSIVCLAQPAHVSSICMSFYVCVYAHSNRVIKQNFEDRSWNGSILGYLEQNLKLLYHYELPIYMLDLSRVCVVVDQHLSTTPNSRNIDVITKCWQPLTCDSSLARPDILIGVVATCMSRIVGSFGHSQNLPCSYIIERFLGLMLHKHSLCMGVEMLNFQLLY